MKLVTNPVAPCAVFLLALTLPTFSAPQSAPAVDRAAPQAPFRTLDNIEGDHVDVALFPVRPMALDASRRTLYAANVHGSQVHAFTDLSGTPERSFDVPWGPVSLALWSPGGGPNGTREELLVVTRGTHGLTRLDPETGEIRAFLELHSEPADVLVLGDHAFVSCSAEDLVVEVDLPANRVHDRFEVATSRHPLFLSRDGDHVLVAPMLSGNNSLVNTEAIGFIDAQTTVAEASSFLRNDLPDHDLFRLIPGDEPFSGTVEVAARTLGTSLFAHGTNPRTGRFWALNVEANNKDPERQTEEAVRGEIAFNRLTITDLPPAGSGAAQAGDHEIHLLDDADPSTPEIDYSRHHSLGKPYALAFLKGGQALVAGTLTDNVRGLDKQGRTLGQWRLPRGSLPRAVLPLRRGLAAVLCWGTNEVRVHDLQAGFAHVATLDLGHDPTPGAARRGREIFYYGGNSLHGNASCETCHPEGGSDLQIWKLAERLDPKSALATRGLKGLEGTLPYHWRGERADIEDFNSAFGSLLGGTPLGGEDFADLKAFLFSLHQPANPFEHESRVVTDDVQGTRFDRYQPAMFSQYLPPPEEASAVAGQRDFFGEGSPFFDCTRCHALPTGTQNDFTLDHTAGLSGHASTFPAAPLQGLWRRQSLELLNVRTQKPPAVVQPRQPVGGLGRAGVSATMLTSISSHTLLAPSVMDVAFFMHQLDGGLAPAAHQAFLVGPETVARNAARVEGHLLDQARKRNCDLAVLGENRIGGFSERMRWFWDRSSDRFVAEDGTLAPRELAFFLDQARAGEGWSLFLGLPVGTARRFAVDADGDGVLNGDEAALGTDPMDADTDGDGFLDGTERVHGGDPADPSSHPNDGVAPTVLSARVVYVTARVAKVIVETDAPSRVRVEYSGSDFPARSVEKEELRRVHTVFLRDLRPSHDEYSVDRVYTARVIASDESGNEAQHDLPPFRTLGHPLVFEYPRFPETVATAITTRNVRALPQGGFALAFDVQIEDRVLDSPAPVSTRLAVGRVLVNGELVPSEDLLVNGAPPARTMTTVIHTPGFGNDPYPYLVKGPFVIGSRSDVTGVSTIAFELPNAVPGDRVQVLLETITGPLSFQNFDPTRPIFEWLRHTFVFGATDPEHRASEEVILGATVSAPPRR